MTSMPEVLAGTFEVDDEVLELARAWRAEFQKTPTPIDVVVTTNANYATCSCVSTPLRSPPPRRRERSKWDLLSEPPHGHARFVLEAAER